MITLDLSTFYEKTAKLDQLEYYRVKSRELAGQGNHITLTGAAPVWLYLAIAHELHGIATSLAYESPVTGSVTIFDHDPF